jgi:ornithine cyclodeaminase
MGEITMIGPEAERHLSWPGLLAALQAGHRLPPAEIADVLLHQGQDKLLNRSAWSANLGALVKVATVFPGNPARGLASVNGALNLFDAASGQLAALIDFHLLTKWKTAGDSLLAATRLARPSSRRFLIVGAGVVARSMVQAYRAHWHDAQFQVWARDAGRAAALGLPVAPDLAPAVAAADVICTATMAETPLIRGEWLQPGQHLDLIGAYTPAMREVDDTAMARARLFVDSRATTIDHIGEIMAPIASGAITRTAITADFYDDPALFTRRNAAEITIAKNGGGAHLDLMTARYICDAVAAAAAANAPARAKATA